MIDVVVVWNDEGISGGGNVEPVVKPTFVDELSWSSVGGFITLADGFWARGAVEPNGFVLPEETNESKRKIVFFFIFITFWFCNKFIKIN